MSKVFDQGLLSPQAGHAAWLNLIAKTDESNKPVLAEGALAYVVASGCYDVDAIVLTAQGIQGPVLHAVLSNLAHDKAIGKDLHQTCLDLPDNLDKPWPVEVLSLSANERLAAWLLVHGANPWTVDSNGRDALDLAFRAGSRSLFKALLLHPARPSLESLQARTDNSADRQLPWLHAAAYQGRLELFGDLVGAGWPAQALDRSGWLPLAWVNHASEVAAILTHGPALSEAQQAAVCQAWGRRKTQKLVRGKFELSGLADALDATAPLSENQRAESDRIHKMQVMLAAAPNIKTYHYNGWDKVLVKDPAALTKVLEDSWDWVYSAPSGAIKGDWSMASAMLWGQLRGARDPKTEAAFLDVFVPLLVAKGAQDGWLEKEVRPSTSGKQAQAAVRASGLLWWMMSSQTTLSQHAMMASLQPVEAMWSAEEGRRRGFEEAVIFTAAFTKPSSSSQWLKLAADRWSNTCLKLMRSPAHAWEFDGWNKLMQLGLKLSQEVGQALTSAAVRAVSAPSADPAASKAAFQWLLQSMSVSTPFLLPYAAQDRERQRLSQRATAVAAVLSAHRQDPNNYPIPLDCPAPFTSQDLSAMANGVHSHVPGTQDMPSPETWAALLREDRLKHALGEAPQALPTRARM